MEMKAIITLVFEDKGQDFLEWDLDKNNVVVGCRPFQYRMWRGVKVFAPKVGRMPKIEHPSLEKETLAYKIISISMSRRPDDAK